MNEEERRKGETNSTSEWSQDVTYLCPRMFGCFWRQFNETVLFTSSFNMYLTATYHSLIHLYTERQRGRKEEVGRRFKQTCVLVSLTSFLTVSAILGVLKVMYDTLQY